MLKDYLKKYSKDIYPMHMPGHKGGRYRLLKDFYQLDVTEVPGTDHLYQANSILKESMDRMSDFYGTTKTVFLVNGSTVGILSAMGGLHVAGDEILIARNCHQSVYNGLSLYGLKPIYVYPRMTEHGLIGGIDPEEVRKILEANPRIVSFVMTSPTYDGFLSDIKAIHGVCRRYNVLLIVDEAHGAHLPYSKQLPPSALEWGAEVVVHSLHKTMPAITGVGLLHLNLPKSDEAAVVNELALLQTSSPSYIMMANADACVQNLGKKQDLWTDLLKEIKELNQRLDKMKKLRPIHDYSSINAAVSATDPLKSIVVTGNSPVSGHDLERQLRYNHHIQMELSDTLHTLGIITVADNSKSLKRYGTSLIKLDRKVPKLKNSPQTFRFPKGAEQVKLPFEVKDSPYERVPLKEADGLIAAANITPYPPGIPIVVQGEKIDSHMIAYVEHWLSKGLDVPGVEDGCVKCIKA